jgi:hypothetical protein
MKSLYKQGKAFGLKERGASARSNNTHHYISLTSLSESQRKLAQYTGL